MNLPIKVTGMVLSSVQHAEYDRRLVLLTKERGKITVFANGVRRSRNPLQNATNPFAFGTFSVSESGSSYRLSGAEISNYFMDVREDIEAACYGCYFLEVAEYYTRENLDASDVLNLLYVTLRALMRPNLDHELVRCVFEMKAMVLNGEYPYDIVQDTSLKESTRYALDYVIRTPLQKLYSFTLTPDVFAEFRRVQDYFNHRQIDRKFKSLEILKSLKETVETSAF